ncbi:MAG TPA: spermidine/putrescine ABC transporter substrate-binding protein [Actinomycetota bacterium]|nr:spermidine/putrescine ABC transporter substrate-binding protein [Actinomycetota bacterium]
MLRHPRERRPMLSRRDFLLRAGTAGIALPTLAAILAACGGDEGGATGGGQTGGGTGLQLARPDNPVTIPITDDNPPIADGLDPEAGPLQVFGYNDYIWKKVRNQFSDQFGADVEYTVFDTPEEMVAKMQSQGSDFDIIVTVTPENVGKLGFGGLIQPLNKTYVPNFDNVWPNLQSPLYDVDSNYTVPYTVYTTGIGYRNDLVDDPSQLENPYDILWDTSYAGQTHLLNGARDTIAAALLRMNEDVNTEDPGVLDQAKQMLLEGVDKMNWKFDHVDYNELGSFEVHMTWSGQVSYYQYYLPKGEQITQYSYVWPAATNANLQGILTNDVFAIPKGAKNPVLAHKMIDFLLDPEHAITNYSYEGFQPPIVQFHNQQAVADGIVPENLANTLLTPEDFDRPNAVRELELSPTANQLWQQIYQEVTGGV